MPYQVDPVKSAFEGATLALSDASRAVGPKRGVVVLGEANAGKTRLALEALRRTLPEWDVLVWSEAYSAADLPSSATITGRSIALFLDDLPDYATASAGSGSGTVAAIANPTATLRALEYRLHDARRAIVVATCRGEDEERTRASLGWLFTKLTPIRLPRFSENSADPLAGQIIEKFARAGAHFATSSTWDGTIGSLVLGLDVKHDQYEGLRVGKRPAVSLLHAAKLLTLAGISEHTEPRLRAVGARIMGEAALESDERVWKDALDDVTRLQFMRQARGKDDRTTMLVIRKDAYFEQVVSDYPTRDQPYQLEEHLVRLRTVLAMLTDAEALSALGDVAERHGRYQLAADSLRSSVDIRRAREDTRGEASDLAALGLVEVRRGNLVAAEAYLARAQNLASEQGERSVEAEILNYRGAVAQRHGLREQAEDFFERALRSYQDVHDQQGIGATLGYLGRAARRRGELETAERYFLDGLKSLRDVQDRQGEGFFLHDLAEVELKRGHLDAAGDYFRRSVEILREVQDRQGEGVVLYGLGRLALQERRLQQAEEMLQHALDVLREESDPYYESKILCSLAEVAEARGDLRAAEERASASLTLAQSSDLAHEVVEAEQVLARVRTGPAQ